MEYLLVIVVALLAIIAVVVIFNFLGNRKLRKLEEQGLHQRTHGPADPFSSADDDSVYGNPRTLKPGDLVEFRGQTHAVRGTLVLTQGSFQWTEHFLDTGLGSKAWLSVEDDPDLEVILWRELKGVTTVPGPQTIELDGGRRYESDESGSATFTSTGTTGLNPTGSLRYHDYQAGDERLSFEDFGGGWECARGEVLDAGEYRIYPSSSAPGPP
ncbi:DUF4178 domain-containing protein [Gordonia sp. ABSL49_1]|uniref:DUF4178 domain-containing protein n=1 Tax=unclassified Gordonia (in: high G+C Gram-positive bacteria) TaxID=2657482 RepID=UPI001F1070CF|nr:DUF4178 domain-containing protein [Gordonia sp. ABSL49_1]MCH5644035.1 DUF4178 domain-containing protein [Gordonia sp. ABSL49_1]